MPFLIPLAGAAIGGLSGLFGGKDKKQDTSSTQQTNSTSTSTPNLSPQQQELIQNILNQAYTQSAQDQDLSGYTAQGLRTIGDNSNLKSKTVNNLLASRGLSFSPAGVNQLANVQGDKLAQDAQFENSIPLLQRSLKEDSLTNLMKSFGLIPTGSTVTSSSNSSGTGQQVQQGNPLAGLFSGAGAGLFSGLDLQNSMNKQQTIPNNPFSYLQ